MRRPAAGWGCVVLLASGVRAAAPVGATASGSTAFISAPVGSAAPGATVYGSGFTGPQLRIEHAVPPAGPRSRVRLAYSIDRDEQGRPIVHAYSFLLSSVAFSRLGGVYPWPALCEYQWGWNELTQRLVPQRSSGLLRDPDCVLRGTVHVTGFLSPRIDVRPVVQVTVEGARETVALSARVVLHDPRRVSWTGIPVVLAELPTTELEDGFHRLRVDGGFREYRIDGDPGTTRFEEGGDATVEFLVNNRPPRLVSLAIFAGSATAYRGAWRRERIGGLAQFRLDRVGGDLRTPPSGAGDVAVVALEFSVPVSRVTVEARRADGARRKAVVLDLTADERSALVWRAALPWRDWRPGEWAIRVAAGTNRGLTIEPLDGEPVPEASLGRLDPESGACVACRTGVDTSHRVRRTAPH